MTAFDPRLATERDGEGHFPVVLRGYDRQLVDARLGELAGQLERERRERADAEQRLRQVDSGNALAVPDQPTASFVNLGARAAKVFEEAGAVAERLIGEAQEQARMIIDAAHAEAAERLGAAEEQASELEQAARQTLTEAEAEKARIEVEAADAAEALLADTDRDVQAERATAREEIRRAWHKADGERLLVEAETQRLETLRQILAEQLGQVQTHLGLALHAASGWADGEDGPDVETGQSEPAAGAIGADDKGGPDVDTGQVEPTAEAGVADGDGGSAVESEQAGPPGRATAAQ